MNPAASASLAFPVFVQGLLLSFGLIVAIGARDAFVLRQGLRREHAASVVLFCAAADAVLIAAVMMGMAQALGESPNLARALALAGAAFLATYGWQALRRARQAHRLDASQAGSALTLRPWFARPKAWQVLDGLIGVTMFVPSALLLRHALVGM